MENHLPFAYYDMGAPIDEDTVIRCSKDGIPAPIIHSGRRSGNTTRLVDYYIQVLFKTGTTTILDHFSEANHSGHSMPMILRTIIQRLQNEHRMDNRNFDLEKNTITLKHFQR